MRSIRIALNPRHDLYHSGYLVSAAVSARAAIRLDPAVHPLVPRIETGSRRYAVDLRDSSRVFDEASMAECDRYLKRGYVGGDVPAAYREKVAPFGLNYSCRTLGSMIKVLSLYGLHGATPGGWKNYVMSPSPETFEVPATEGYEAKVLFQTRIWPADELDIHDDPEEINGFRIRMLKELRRAFGKRFVGGLVPTQEASAYPDLITNMPTRRREYAAWTRPPAIGIYTRGVHGSNAFKLAEYLAASKCIVGQSLAHELPQALGECHSARETVEETVAECDALLSNPARLQNCRRASWEYYQSQLRYDRRMALLLGE